MLSDDEGWGVVDSDETPGGCWVHFSAVAIEGLRTAVVGRAYLLEWQAFEQDGYGYRAVRLWPVDSEPVQAPPPRQGSAAYGSVWLPRRQL